MRISLHKTPIENAFGDGALGSNSTCNNNNTAKGNYALFFSAAGSYNTAAGFSFRFNTYRIN